MRHEVKESNGFERWASIDLLRVSAATCVFVHHALTMAELDPQIGHGLRLGRFGTTTFFAIAGLLAASTARRPEAWLWQRLRTIYIPFWIALAISVFGVALTSHKRMDAWQLISQFAGTGHFTHPDRLVNVPTWFISVLLVLYLLAFISKCAGDRPLIVIGLFGVFWFVMRCLGVQADTICAGSMFLVGYTLPLFGRRPWFVALGWAAILALAAVVWPELRYGAVALLLLSAASYCKGNSPRLRTVASYSYPWFLMHGLSLHAARWLVGLQFVPLLLLGSCISFVASVLLRRTTAKVNRLVDKYVIARLQRLESAPNVEVENSQVARNQLLTPDT